MSNNHREVTRRALIQYEAKCIDMQTDVFTDELKARWREERELCRSATVALDAESKA